MVLTFLHSYIDTINKVFTKTLNIKKKFERFLNKKICIIIPKIPKTFKYQIYLLHKYI